jgi:hypothetical protein
MYAQFILFNLLYFILGFPEGKVTVFMAGDSMMSIKEARKLT